MAPRKVDRNVMKAYEIRSGFVGLGEFLEQRGKIILFEEGGTCSLNANRK